MSKRIKEACPNNEGCVMCPEFEFEGVSNICGIWNRAYANLMEKLRYGG